MSAGYVTDKLCSRCGLNERMISSGGKQLTMCEACQRQDWAARGRARALPDPSTPRACVVCYEMKTVTDFPRSGTTYRNTCKLCYAAQTANEDGEKTCARCGETKSLTAYHVNSGTNRRPECKPCSAAIARERRYAQAAAGVTPTPRTPRTVSAPRAKPAVRAVSDRPVKALPQPRPVREQAGLQPLPILPLEGNVVLVDRARGQVIVAQLLSEIPNSAKRLHHLIAAFRAKGLRIIDTHDSEASS